MAAVKRWLGLPETPTMKDKIKALKEKDAQYSASLTKNYKELEALLVKDKTES